MIPKVNLKDKIKEIGGRPWFPVDVARVNNQVVRLALYKGEYHWHKHDNEDEFFYVLQGRITIQMKDHPDLALCEGDMAVVPKGIEHCPKSGIESYVLMFEPYELKSKWD